MSRILPLLMLFSLLAGCQDEGPVSTEPPGSPQSALLTDGTLEDSPDVTWLEPLPPTATTVSVFNPNLDPVIEVWRLACPPSNDACESVATFTTDGSGRDVVRVATDGDWYIVNWKFIDLPFVQDEEFLIQASLSTVVLEEALVKRVRKGTLEVNGKKHDLDGKLPIKFQIFEESTSSARRLVTNAGGLVCTPDDFRCLDAPEGWLNLYPTSFALTGVIVNVFARTSEPCLPLPVGLPQAGGCMSIDLEDPTTGDPIALNFPDPRFAESDHRPRAEQCLDPDVAAEEYAQWKFTSEQFDPFQNRIRETGITKPDPAFATEVNCERFVWPPDQTLALGGGSLFDRARALAQPLVGLLSPRPLFAGDLKAGSLLGSTSDLGWVKEDRINKIAGDNQTALEGSQVASDPTVLVTAGHDFGGNGGVPVTFTAFGGGEVTTDGQTFSSSATVTADPFGRASVGWQLGSCQDSQTLQAEFIDEQKQVQRVVFTATATCR